MVSQVEAVVSAEAEESRYFKHVVRITARPDQVLSAIDCTLAAHNVLELAVHVQATGMRQILYFET